MGMYDTVYWDCPDCGNTLEAQSKGGPCNLDIHHGHAVPLDVASDITRHGSNLECDNCGATFEMILPETQTISIPIRRR